MLSHESRVGKKKYMPWRKWEVWNNLSLKEVQDDQEVKVKAIPNLFNPRACREKQGDREEARRDQITIITVSHSFVS